MSENLENTFLDALEKNQQKLLRICSVYATNSEDKRDLFQEVLIHIWKALPSFEGNSSIGTWMYRITLNICLRFRSKRTNDLDKFKPFDSFQIAVSKQEHLQDEPDNRLIFLKNCIKELNEADKAIIALYLEELSYREISAITGLLENTIAVKIKRIKRKLLNCIEAKS